MLPSSCHTHHQNELPGMRAITTLAISSSQKLLAPSAISRSAAPSTTIPQRTGVEFQVVTAVVRAACDSPMRP